MKSKYGIPKRDLESDDYQIMGNGYSKNKNKSELTFRSTFHKTVSGRFLDLPPLNDKQHKRKNFDPSKRVSMNDFPKVPSTSTNVVPYHTSSNFNSRRNMFPDMIHSSQSRERPVNRGRPNWIGLDLRPATPINVIKITAIGWVEDEFTGQKKAIKKTKHSLSLSPIRNTLAQYKDKCQNSAIKTKHTDSKFDSTQESLTIEAYMQNNSTIAIEEVDEDDYEHLPLIHKIEKPKELPTLNYSPRFNDTKNKSKTRNKNCQK